ncbi:MAG: hypothetical protein F6K18_28830 [Okeania sp. SIO2C2]|uniref:hypothetical protein n=1 Tax=Okeania sp. SIO2C2 TaxID=2607787 RepID=UPI0013BE1835|nr:hypothetical protein [Okeania sp. SIO2C2]NEP90503.1 hypothetical protein [Okeania sp. SIO2C2]
MVVCNYWGSLVPTHDFLFNSKTAFYKLSIYIEAQKRSPTITSEDKKSLCEAPKDFSHRDFYKYINKLTGRSLP